MNTTHELKCDPTPFTHSCMGKKPFEIRKNDRNFKVGDTVILKETKFSSEEMVKGSPLEYTGKHLVYIVTCVTSGYGLEPGYVVLGFGSLTP